MVITLTHITDYLLDQSVQIALLVVVVAAVNLALRNKSAHVRYLLWLIVLAKCLVPPFYAMPLAILPPQEKAEPAPTSVPAEMRTPQHQADTARIEPSGLRPSTSPMPPLPTAQKARHRMTVHEWLGLGWAAGAVVFLIFNLLRALRANLWLWRRRMALPSEWQNNVADLFADYGVKRFPRIWLVEGFSQPFVWGLWRGSIYLPIDFLKINKLEHQRNVLSHELSHVLRFDAAVNILQVISQAIFWFHPLIWWANRKIRAEREKCCDEMAVARLNTSPRDYGTAILETLATRHEQTRPIPSLAVAGPIKNIEERIKTMLIPGKKFYKHPSVVVATIVSLLALLTVPTTFVLTARAGTQADAKSLRQAVAAGDVEQVKSLISRGADVNARDEDGRTPLHLALELHRRKVAEYLISIVPDVNLTNNKGQTPLHLALIHWSPNLADQLIIKGADVHARDKNGRTALHEAARRSQRVIVKRLITEGADINAKDAVGSIPVMEAMRGGRLLFADELIQMGADVSCGHLAAYLGDLAVLRKRIEKTGHADSPWGFTWLHAAAAGGHREIVEFLIEKGFDVNAITQELVMDPGGTPLHYAACRGSKEVIKLLLDKGAELDADKGDSTPLAWAAWANQKDMAELLVSKGADVNKGEPPLLHEAIEWWETHMAEILLELGADINVRDKKGNTPLHRATHEWFLEMGNLLISRGAYLNARNKEGQTPLHMAADDEFVEMARLLINNGADVNAKDWEGKTPLSVAQEAGNTDIVELLKKHGAKE